MTLTMYSLFAVKAFFQRFISVGDIGPMKAVKALGISSHEIARAIESKDVGRLSQLKGIGARTAQKIIATLSGKMDKFALIRKEEEPGAYAPEDFEQQVFDVLVLQLGHKASDAKRMITAALKRNKFVSTPEELFEEVYRGESKS